MPLNTDTSIDTLIASQLPGWLVAAAPEHQRALQAALLAQLRAHQALQPVLADTLAPDAFAAPLLGARLQQETGQAVDVRRATLHLVAHVPVASAVATTPAQFQRHEHVQSLLACALHNFAQADLQAGALSTESKVQDAQGAVLALAPRRFAELCRQLDLGKQYQAYLNARLQGLEAALEEALRANLEVAVRLARAKGTLSQDNYLRLLRVIATQPIVPSDDAVLQPHRLRLLGKPVHGVLAIEIRRAGQLEGIVLWSPGDGYGDLTLHASWGGLYVALAGRLAQPGYAGFFQRFIAERDRGAFAGALARQLGAAQGVPLALDGRHEALDGALFEQLRRAQVARWLDDARVLAVPTDDEDRSARFNRLQFYKNAALDLLGLAAFFAPGLGVLVLGATALSLAGEVYEGYADWQQGDREAALGQLFDVAANLAATAAAVGTGVVAEAVGRRAFVDGLTPTRVDGRLKLANLEYPQQWQAEGELLRKLDPAFAGLDDLRVRHVLESTGLQADQLRRLYVEQAGAPARLRDAVQRYDMHAQQPTLRGEALEAQLAAAQPPLEPAAQPLQRDFPGLSARAAEEILAQASDSQRSSLGERQRVPLALAEQARWSVHDSRLDRACAGLRLPRAVNADTEQLALGLVQGLAPWPEAVRLELREGSADGAVLASAGKAEATEVRLLVRHAEQYQAIDGQGQGMGAGPSDLLPALWLQLDTLQKTTLGTLTDAGGLADALARQARAERVQAARLIGLATPPGRVRPPLRLGDGRLGYPLSGRGESSRMAVRRALHRVFPTLADDELDQYLNDLRQRGVDPWAHLRQLGEQQGNLQQVLQQWMGEAPSLRSRLGRGRAAERFRRSWRRKTGQVADGYRLVIDDEVLERLPALPPGLMFEHVTLLSLRNLRLTRVDADFFSRFPNLRVLDLAGNALAALPQGIEQLTRLTHLRLGDNRIVLDRAAVQRLQRLAQLRELDLAGNPLGMAPDISGMPALREVYLRDTGLETPPPSVLQHPFVARVDLRGNRIRQLGEALLALPARRLQALSLHDNPLPADSQLQLQAGGAVPTLGGAHAQLDAGVRDLWLGRSVGAQRSTRLARWDRLREEPGADGLFRYLADLARSKVYRLREKVLREQVWAILEHCEHNSEVREAVFSQASSAASCADHMLLTLSNLETTVMVVERSAGHTGRYAERALLRLGRDLFRLDEVERIAAEHITTQVRMHPMGLIDEVEVGLAYRVGLAEPLGLPAQPGFMFYSRLSGVTAMHLNAARGRVITAQTPQALARSLVQREFWVNHLYSRFAARFNEMNRPFHERLEALEAQAADLALGVYLPQVEQVASERNDAEQQLLQALTEEALARYPQ